MHKKLCSVLHCIVSLLPVKVQKPLPSTACVACYDYAFMRLLEEIYLQRTRLHGRRESLVIVRYINRICNRPLETHTQSMFPGTSSVPP